MSECYSSEKMDTLRKLFKQLAELINQFTNLVTHSHFIFVPGLEDPCTSYVVPRYIVRRKEIMLTVTIF